MTSSRPRRVSLLLVAASALSVAAPHAVGAELRASAGTVEAVLSGSRGADGATTTLTVTRAGTPTTFTGLEGRDRVWEPSGFLPLTLRDLDGDGEPEVLAPLFSGGAHCCTRAVVARWDAATGRYTTVTRDFGETAWRLRDLDGDGAPELVSADGRWAYWPDDYASSGFPVRILRVGASGFRDVTRAFPAEIARDQALWWRQYLRARRSPVPGRGALAAYMADAYARGTEAVAWRRVYAAYRLRGRDRFFLALRNRLTTLGYRRPGTPVPPVTRVAPEVPVIACTDGGRILRRVRPGRCVARAAGSGAAGVWTLVGVRWRGWGAAGAIGTATAVGRKGQTLLAGRTPVRVRATGFTRGCDGRLWYGRLVIALRGGRVALDLDACTRRG